MAIQLRCTAPLPFELSTHQLPAFMVTLRRVVCKEARAATQLVSNSSRPGGYRQGFGGSIARYLAWVPSQLGKFRERRGPEEPQRTEEMGVGGATLARSLRGTQARALLCGFAIALLQPNRGRSSPGEGSPGHRRCARRWGGRRRRRPLCGG